MHSDMHSHDYLRVLIERRDTIEKIMARYLSGSDDRASDQEQAAAHQLMDVLFHELDGSLGSGHMIDPLVRRCASDFGDGLSPVLKDVLGPDVPEAFIAKCVDGYWSSFRATAA